MIDTSGPEGYLAIAFQGQLVHTLILPQNRQFSKILFPSILSLLEKSGLQKPDFIAVGKGPGTFTGTRVGAITAEALSYGWQIPLIPFCSSELPHLHQIAQNTYEKYLNNEANAHIELAYRENCKKFLIVSGK